MVDKKKFISRTSFGYASYTFKDHDPAIDKLRTIIQQSGLNYKQLAAGSGVGRQTISGWFDGKVRRPQHASLEAVARVCGKSFELVETPPEEDRRQSRAMRLFDFVGKYAKKDKRKPVTFPPRHKQTSTLNHR